MNISYREAVPADASTIAQFQFQMAWETEKVELDRNVLARGVQAVFENPAHGRYYVAELDGRVAGCTLLTYEWSDWRDGTVWWIQSVYVIPALRRQGVYAGLYAHIKSIAQQDPAIKGIRLYVDRSNAGAQVVYTRLGMNGEHYQVFEWMKG